MRVQRNRRRIMASAPGGDADTSRTCSCLPPPKTEEQKQGEKMALSEVPCGSALLWHALRRAHRSLTAPLSVQGQTFEIAQDRGCTDILCTLIFILFWLAMFIIGGTILIVPTGHW